MKLRMLGGLGLCLALCAPASAAPVIRTGSDPASSATNTTAARDAFRQDLGGGTTEGTDGGFGGRRREINWDTAAYGSPPDYSNSRGIVFSNAASGTFEVSGASTDPPGTLNNFGDLNPNYVNYFAPFTPQRLFTGVGTNVTEVFFQVPGTAANPGGPTPALVSGFGAVFSDVDRPSTTAIEYLDASDNVVLTLYVPPSPSSSKGLSFAGATFPDGPLIRMVRITAGNAPVDGTTLDDSSHDLVVMDDMLYTEPNVAGTDGDAVADAPDNCPATFNPDQRDTDGDAQGDACDTDDDGDGAADTSDNCPLDANPGQADNDGDGTGNACDPAPDPPAREVTQTAGPGPGQGSVADVTAPGLTRFGVAPQTFKRRKGAIVGWALSEAAAVHFTVAKRRHVKCPKQKRKKGRRCFAYRPVNGSLDRQGVLGANSFRWFGVLGTTRLGAGRYKLVAQATDAAGNRSRVARTSFRIR